MSIRKWIGPARALALALSCCLPAGALSCGASAEDLKTRAAFDLNCPVESLTVIRLDLRTRGVAGCNKRATYVCPLMANFGATCATWVMNNVGESQDASGAASQAEGPADPTNQVVSFLYDLRNRDYAMAVARMTRFYVDAQGATGLQAAVERTPDLAGHTDAEAPRNQVSLAAGPPMISVQRGTLTTSGGDVPFAAELRYEAGIFRISRLWIGEKEVLSDGSPAAGH